MVKFSQLFAKIQLENIDNFDVETFNFPFFKEKIGQFSKLLFAKIMRNSERKKSLLPIYQGFLAFQSCQKSEPNNHPNYRSFDEREEERKTKKNWSYSLAVSWITNKRTNET